MQNIFLPWVAWRISEAILFEMCLINTHLGEVRHDGPGDWYSSFGSQKQPMLN